MPKAPGGSEQLLCSFCGKSQRQVKKLIAGPGVYICDECIDLCNEIIDEEFAPPPTLDLENLPKPKEIHSILADYVIGQEEAKRALESTESQARPSLGGASSAAHKEQFIAYHARVDNPAEKG